MKTIFFFILLLGIHANAQTIYDKIQDSKITKTLSSDSMLLSKLAIQTIRGNSIIIKQMVDSLVTDNLIIRSERSGKRIIALEADSLAQKKLITILQTQVKQLQTDRTSLTAKVTSLETRLKVVEKINSLTGDFPTGSIKLTKVGTSLLYKISNTDVTSLKPGNMTVYYKLKVDELLVRMAAQEKFNIQLQSSFLRK